MKTLIAIIAIVLISGSGIHDNHVDENQLSNDQTINQVFDKNEIRDLQRLFDFFNQNICSDNATIELTECYRAFLSNLYEEANDGGYFFYIPIQKQRSAHEEISEQLFQEIWTVGEAWSYAASPQFGYQNIGINPFGKYSQFLKEVGKEYENINNYYVGLLEAGDVPPSISYDLLFNYHLYNTEDIKVKLTFAIHYLTLNYNSQSLREAYSKSR